MQSIYQQHADALLDYGCRFCPDINTVEDHIHDLFVYIWKNRDRLGTTDSIRAYLLLSLRRSILKGVKRQSKTTSMAEDTLSYFRIESAVEDQIIKVEEDEQNSLKLQEALLDLSDRQREAIYLKYFKNMDYHEISKIMGINYQSVRNLIFNGLKSLRRTMALILVYIFLGI